MLAKVNNTPLNIYDIIYEDNSVKSGQSGGWADCYTFTATDSYTIEYSLYTSLANYSGFMINKNGGTIEQYAGGSTKTGSFSVVNNDVVNLKESYRSGVQFNISLKRFLISISKTISTHKSKPRQLKGVGEKATATLFGYHIDNTRYNIETA